jgi:hypothetical protein
MKQEIQASLDAVFEKHEASKRIAALAKQTGETKESEFLRAFLEARETIVRPAMQAIGEYVKSKGYDFSISTREEGYERAEPGRRYIPASIALQLYLGGTPRGAQEAPGLTVICEKSNQRVWFHENTIGGSRGGHSGSAGEVARSGGS